MNLRWRVFNRIRRLFDIPGEYGVYSPYYYIYSPWRNTHTSNVLATADRAYILQCFARHCKGIQGEFVECGVYRGGTAKIIATEANGLKETHLFDTFEGMPLMARCDPSKHKPGEMGDTSLNLVKDFLKDLKEIYYHPGILPDTLTEVSTKSFSFIHMDLDLYYPTKKTLEFLYPRLNQGGIIIFDNYGFLGYEEAERKAVDEFFSDKIEKCIMLPTGQGLVIKI